MSSMKTIFISGAASGIGKATAIFFADKGWYVGLYDIDETGLQRLHAQIGEKQSCWSSLDVSDRDSVEQAISHFAAHTQGRMDVLFNNAGILRVGFFDKLGMDEQAKTVDVNLKGVMYCTYAALPWLKKTKGARIVSMSSASSVYGTAHMAAYSATKAAVSSLTESLNLELEGFGIHVSDIRVPYVHTPLLETKTKAASLETMGAKLSPEDVAAMVYSSLESRAVHYEGKGMLPLLMLRRFAPMMVQKAVLKYIMMPR